MGCLMDFYTSLTLFYMKMSFIILKFSNRPSVFLGGVKFTKKP
jgi:hypothetical protein